MNPWRVRSSLAVPASSHCFRRERARPPPNGRHRALLRDAQQLDSPCRAVHYTQRSLHMRALFAAGFSFTHEGARMVKHAFGIVVACLCLSIPGYAQTLGTITGEVKD